MAVRRRGVQAVADVRRDVLHRVHTEPVRDSAGPVPGHHAADSVRAEAHRVADHVDGGASVDSQRGHMLAAADRLERLAGRVRRAHPVRAHHAPRLRGVLVHGLVLHTADGDEHHLPEDLHSHPPASETPGQTGGHVARRLRATGGRRGNGGTGSGQLVVQEGQEEGGHRRRRLAQQQRRGGRGPEFRWQRTGGAGVRQKVQEPTVVRHVRQTREPAAGAQAAHIAVQRAEGGQDVGRHHGRVRRQLAAVFRHLPVLPVLQNVLSAVQGARQRGHVARLPQLHNQSDHIHPVQHGLPQIVQEDSAHGPPAPLMSAHVSSRPKLQRY